MINIQEAITFIKLRKTVTLLLTLILSHRNAVCNVYYTKLYLFTNLCNIYYIST